MCPVCIENAVVMIAGAGSAGGVLAICIAKFRSFLKASGLALIPKTNEK